MIDIIIVTIINIITIFIIISKLEIISKWLHNNWFFMIIAITKNGIHCLNFTEWLQNTMIPPTNNLKQYNHGHFILFQHGHLREISGKDAMALLELHHCIMDLLPFHA